MIGRKGEEREVPQAVRLGQMSSFSLSELLAQDRGWEGATKLDRVFLGEALAAEFGRKSA